MEVQTADPVRSIESNDLARERDFYRAKLVETGLRIKSLEYDNAELVKRCGVLSKRLEENSTKLPFRPRRKG
tara:strand:- start:1273 stop:1488 length:216 start_codon:yes stop_codon:yes gene_type:complete